MSEAKVLEAWIAKALPVLATLEGEDSEDGGQALAALLKSGKRLVCKHPRMQTTHFTYGLRQWCPDCGYGREDWWD